MACSIPVDSKSDAWITTFWDIKHYIYAFGSIDSPKFNMGSLENIWWSINFFPPEYPGTPSLCSFPGDRNSLRRMQLELEIAFLEENGSVLLLRERKGIKLGNPSEEVNMETEATDIMERGTIPLRETLRIRCRMWRTDGQEATPATFIARTILNVKRIDFRWDIERFSSIKSGQKVSYVLKPLSKFGKKTLIHIEEKKDKIMMSIEFRNATLDHLKLQSFIVDKNGSQKDCGEREVWPVGFDGDKEYVISTLPFTKKYLMDNKDLYLKNDSLSLHFNCSWLIGWFSYQFERMDYGIIIPEPHVSNADMKRLIEMPCLKEYSEYDVKRCERELIQIYEAQKAFLCRIPSAMFPAICKKVEEPEHNLSLGNLCDVLVLADTFEDDLLKDAAPDCALRHGKVLFPESGKCSQKRTLL
ncbi:hypothetical protein TNIN_302611 [Trichonephila inaurata madagascariensis]|uniref:Uncharacterized protein n=1 Tax=Trichonephila inaurata madagascariensis TaxID=2747483 RepID=A0A8X6WSV5_9ARAC|nr:hypothetical protein TNIN_302611 [Trichonephila inaurata madagascariensis]